MRDWNLKEEDNIMETEHGRKDDGGKDKGGGRRRRNRTLAADDKRACRLDPGFSAMSRTSRIWLAESPWYFVLCILCTSR